MNKPSNEHEAMTEESLALQRMNKRHSDGTPVKQIRWFKAVMERLYSGQKEAA